jgi:hypothetical protein
MKLEDYRQNFYEYSGKASDISRQLAFAAIAIIWLFKPGNPGQFALPRELLLPGICVVLALTLDILQYCVASAIWRFYYRSLEKRHASETKDLPKHSEWLERPITSFFVAKLIAMVVAYCLICRYLIGALSFV